MRGGKREGAGRKKGALNQRTQEIIAAASKDGITPLEYLLGVLRDNSADAQLRFKAATEAAPYMHPRLAAVQHSGDRENPLSMQIVSGVPRDDEQEAREPARPN